MSACKGVCTTCRLKTAQLHRQEELKKETASKRIAAMECKGFHLLNSAGIQAQIYIPSESCLLSFSNKI